MDQRTRNMTNVDGIPMGEWKVRLARKGVELFPCPQHRIAFIGYTGCKDAHYTSEEDAIQAAVEQYFG